MNLSLQTTWLSIHLKVFHTDEWPGGTGVHNAEHIIQGCPVYRDLQQICNRPEGAEQVEVMGYTNWFGEANKQNPDVRAAGIAWPMI